MGELNLPTAMNVTNGVNEKLQSDFNSDVTTVSMKNYEFPRQRLKKKLADSNKTPLVLVACGSFSPITLLHLRMFEIAADYARENSDFEIIGGYFSPVGDAYKKAGLAPAHHRLAMCDLALATGSQWLMVDPWEALHEEYLPTALVLDHFQAELNGGGGVETSSGERKKIHIALLAGSDLLQTMGIPGVWSEEDLDHILGHYGAYIIERMGTDTEEALEALEPWLEHIWVIDQPVQNDVSSTKIRTLIKKGHSIQYLVPEAIIPYIKRFSLYEQEGGSTTSLGRSRASFSFSDSIHRLSSRET